MAKKMRDFQFCRIRKHRIKFMKAITFLGTGRYAETTYHFGDKVASVTNLFPKVVCEFFSPTELLVLVTEKAKTMWFQELQNQVAPLKIKVTPIDIPEGHQVEDLWEIFAKLTEQLNENDNVIFDITHSFRTLPFLSFLAASYLRVAKNVNIKGIFYGAFEARIPQPPSDKPFQSNPTDKSPVFDLTPFLDLLSWTTATEQFIKTGNAESISDLIGRFGQTPTTKLDSLAESINKIAVGLNTLRPLYVMEESAKLKSKIKDAETEIKNSLPQLTPLLQKIENDYSQFAVASPKDKNKRTAIQRLSKQLKMVKWYEQRSRWIQALSLARESIVSLVCFLLKKDTLSDNDRTRVGKLIGKFYTNEKNIPYKQDWENALDESLRESLHKFWGGKDNRTHFNLNDSQPDLATLRNDVMHAGQVEDSKPIEQTISEAKQILQEFKKVVGEILKSL